MMKHNNDNVPTKLELLKAVLDFTTDGCSMSPDFTFRSCCVKHDISYVTGDVTRSKADRRLRKCIADKGYPVLAWVYWLAVRIGGAYFYYFGKSAKHRKAYKKYMANKDKID